ncbi:MAG: bifunctional methylenetetrahydrofolate dehydrogenase/methenyltetrahydrofolate cyclohydrolase FolD [Capnocytophaga sp.]|jgi:bifunctional protein folD|uniref:Bifunctional protein FolD n=1 Tax=Capnocytophaga gingivalis TaxID=1017 RepID=A0ABU5Z8Z1_9FLAO|nr:bifunctional methylenetetrahydrofolate dehydrogenase/methenyltetrahydrofolate cyclohydrolase FolD [Capnocytophaga gingivalis]MEB3075437.1 bifunctional methylenetetrahydrofolate dehydrogenase/methenyltetrahydrofolate cyclohydrolase FolD [Capnocytophaga gingivalis]RKW16969.1 MAG: bifunctional methylenetetrahydrofolate dehydrogenase/methenyltetrahydrofolate cyclohydrolase FolD [Capnocytophaga sp.]
MELLDGKKTSTLVQEAIAEEVHKIVAQGQRPPHLVAILVGDNGASMTYVNNKVTACERVGFASSVVNLPENVSQEDLLKEIEKLNEDKGIDGFIVQLPLPKHINEQEVLLAINPDKDADGFHPTNFGRMALGLEAFIPATPYGILELLSQYKIPTDGKNVVVIGRSDIVGRPISILLSQKPWNATVILTHSRTQNLAELTQKADIIIAALGIPNFLKAEMVKEGAVIIDVGITRVKDASAKKGFRIVGDVDFEHVKNKASYITPVPGGVGPMTIAMLMKNTLNAYKRTHKKQ